MENNKFTKYDKKELKDIVDDNWHYIAKIPKNRITKGMCKSAIQQDYNAIQYIPSKFLTEDMYIYSLQIDYQAIKFIPKNKLTKKYCQITFNKSPYAIQYFTERFKTDEFCIKAINTDWQLFQYCNNKSFNLENAEKILDTIVKTENLNNLEKQKQKSLCKIIERLKQAKLYFKINHNLLDSIKNFNVAEKKYDKENKEFVVIKYGFGIIADEVKIFKTFDSFYNYLNGNLTNAELYDYDFKNIDLKKYNINNVNIKSEILIAQGVYDNTFYEKNFNNVQTLVPIKNEEAKSISMLHDTDIRAYGFINYISKYTSIYYVSDIHLDYKIINEFKGHATKYEVEIYIKKFVKRMLSYANSYSQFLVIAGDTANSYEISKMFYTELVNQKKFQPQHIIVILGNHELWNSDMKTEDNFEKLVGLYKNLFDDLGITFLQNDLVFFKPEREVVSSKKLMQMNDIEIQNLSLNSRVTILGGIGFSGYNLQFNANNLIYANTITSLEEEKKLTNEFFDLYKKVKKTIFNKNIIVLTHTPKQDWSNDNFNPNWIYINGHTHINTYCKDNEKVLYADNQLGYYNQDICLKRIDFSIKCNIFQYYQDGIYEIDTKTYKEFYFKLGYRIECNIKDGAIYLLKRHNNYMFVYKNIKNVIYLLNGGTKNKLQNQDIMYYYENMNRYANLIKVNLNSYYEYIKKVSEFVKTFGGSGNIHGAIVDIDYYNHLYVNVYDGKITPYFAFSMTDKVIYEDLRSLLKENCPYLLEKYNSNIENTRTDLIPIKNDLMKSEKTYYEDTRIYRESRILKKIQFLMEDDIIRIWKDNILNSKNIDILMLDTGKTN